jgi:hypothetical protein
VAEASRTCALRPAPNPSSPRPVVALVGRRWSTRARRRHSRPHGQQHRRGDRPWRRSCPDAPLRFVGLADCASATRELARVENDRDSCRFVPPGVPPLDAVNRRVHPRPARALCALEASNDTNAEPSIWSGYRQHHPAEPARGWDDRRYARRSRGGGVVAPQQTLSEADRRLVAAWAADCTDRVLHLGEADAPHDDRPRALIARAHAFAWGELRTAEEIRRRFAGGVSTRDVRASAAMAAAQPPVRPSPSATWARTRSVPPPTQSKPPALLIRTDQKRSKTRSLAARPHVG